MKICGVTNLKDALASCESGADFLGFIFIKGTPRAVTEDTVKSIVHGVSACKVGKVGLFKDTSLEEVARIVSFCDLDHVQFHGSESPGDCVSLKVLLNKNYGRSVKIIKAFKVRDRILPNGQYDLTDYEGADYFVFDTFDKEMSGGTGKSFRWEVLLEEKIAKPFFIAGGLTPGNVLEAVKRVSPYGVDASSGVEDEPGKKNLKLVKEFIQNAKKKT